MATPHFLAALCKAETGVQDIIVELAESLNRHTIKGNPKALENRRMPKDPDSAPRTISTVAKPKGRGRSKKQGQGGAGPKKART